MKNYKAAWPEWLLTAVTTEKEKEFTDWLGDLRLGDVRWGDVRWGDLRLGDVRWGDVFWQDYFDVLWRVPLEIDGLISALKTGKVNGSTYEGACACLCETIANLKHCKYDTIPGLIPDSSRPIERFFLSIQTGDTPATNQFSALAVRWAEAFQELAAANHSI
jgi:hypothetical protein